MAGVSLFCLVVGALVSYVKARAEGLGTTANVGIAERPERMLLTFVVTGLWGLGVPYILPAGLWVLAVASVITLGQRIAAVHRGLAVKPSATDGEAADNIATGEAGTGSAAAAHTIE
jgi:CDP-diacylglycerol--glycerol-3-phosphate 3-phosphatidyltransferase